MTLETQKRLVTQVTTVHGTRCRALTTLLPAQPGHPLSAASVPTAPTARSARPAASRGFGRTIPVDLAAAELVEEPRERARVVGVVQVGDGDLRFRRHTATSCAAAIEPPARRRIRPPDPPRRPSSSATPPPTSPSSPPSWGVSSGHAARRWPRQRNRGRLCLRCGWAGRPRTRLGPSAAGDARNSLDRAAAIIDFWAGADDVSRTAPRAGARPAYAAARR